MTDKYDESRRPAGAHGEQTGTNDAGAERRDGEAASAGQRLSGELKRLGWTAAELADRRKGDSQKVELARRLRAETTMTLAWIADKLTWSRPDRWRTCCANHHENTNM